MFYIDSESSLARSRRKWEAETGMATTSMEPAPSDSGAGHGNPSGGRVTGGQIIDLAYTLWLATVACALMSTISLSIVIALYLVDTTLGLGGDAPLFGPDTYLRVFELAALFGAGAVVAHFLRLRLEAIRRASIMVALPYRIVVNPPNGDTVSKFECSCQVTLALDHERPLAELKLKSDVLKTFLENAFVVAVSDPVIRFSKQKMEQMLRMAALHVLGEGVSAVIISEVRQRRVPTQKKPVAAAANSDIAETPAAAC